MKKSAIIITLLLIAIAIASAGFLLLLPKQRIANIPVAQRGIEVFSPKANDLVFSPLEITGKISGNGWTAFEGQAGTVKLVLDNGEVLFIAYLPVVDEDWMRPVVNFNALIEFVSDKEQNGKLIFHNENPSGEPERNKTFTLPVRIGKTGVSQQ